MPLIPWKILSGDFFGNAANHSPCLSLSKRDLLNSFNEVEMQSRHLNHFSMTAPIFYKKYNLYRGGGISNDHITVSPRLFVDTVIKRHL